MEQTQEKMPQHIMEQIHRLVQKLKEGGMQVDSALDTSVKVVDGNVKYTDSLTITGDINSFRIDARPLEDIKKEQEDQKASILAQSESFTSKLDEVIAVIEPEIAKAAPVVEPK